MPCENRCDEEILICAICGGGMCAACGSCAGCDGRVPMEGKVLRLLGESDAFYEGAYQTQIHLPESALKTIRGRTLLPFITFGYLNAIVRHVPRGARLLELGCGSGMQLAATRYSVTAVELSLSSLRGTPDGYRHRIQADVNGLDFRPGTFDAIAASCFWEHFTPAQKDRLLEKFSRWLKPEGRLILVFDTASRNPGFRWLRRFPDLYQRCFIDHDGHVGLETASENRTRFGAKGFEEVTGVGLNRTLQHLPVYAWMEPYGDVSWVARQISRMGLWLGKRNKLGLAFTGGLHVWDLTLGRVFPLDWSRLYLGVWKRKAGLG